MSGRTGGTGAFEGWRAPVALVTGPVLLVGCLLLDPLKDPILSRQLGLMLFVLVWWIGEAVPLGITALLIPALAVLLGLTNPKEAFKNFAHPLIFLFMGSFIIAEGIVHHGVDRWMARQILKIPFITRSAATVVFAFGAATWFLSMWISNTAATAMMIPLSYSVLRKYALNPSTRKIATGGVLFIAYSASVGGIATPIGTPPNLVTLGFLEELADIKITFFQWMGLVLPASALLFLSVYVIIYLLFLKVPTSQEKDLLDPGISNSEGPLSRAQKSVLISFSFTVLLWLLPGAVALVLGKDHRVSLWLSSHLPESVAAVLGASLLFLLPGDDSSHYAPALSWREASRIDWNTILLFGGGLTLGELTIKTGLGTFLGESAITYLHQGKLLIITALSHIISTTITEFMSNTASSNLIIPVIIAIAREASIPILMPVLGACIAASLAFLLPVSTPPNAIAYGSGYVTIKEMLKAGFLADLVGFVIMVIYLFTLYAMGVIQ